MEICSSVKFYIWSIVHDSWWKKGTWGYTKKIEDAELYDYFVAKNICDSSNGFINPPTVEMVAQTNLKRIKEIGCV